jgi:type II secretory pathway pseudopilin PulG
VTVRPGKLLLAATLLVVLGVVGGGLLLAGHVKPARPFVLDKTQAAQAAQNLAIARRALQAARVQLRAALPEIEAYASDHGNSYLGMTTARLRAQSKRQLTGIEIVYADRSDYCAESSVDGYGVIQSRPGGPIVEGGCAA